jgi:hypothetical protein
VCPTGHRRPQALRHGDGGRPIFSYGVAVMVSGREAGRMLRGVLSSDEHARILLRTGIAGAPQRISSGLAFDGVRVEELRSRPLVDERELAPVCPHGVVVVRLPRTQPLDLTVPWEAIAAQVAGTTARQRPMTAWSAALTTVRISAWGPIPFVATLLGYVVLTGDLLALAEHGPRLARAGEWAAAVEGRRFPTPPGGRPWHLWLPREGARTSRRPGG